MTQRAFSNIDRKVPATGAIDLSRLPPPKVIEELSLETITREIKDSFLSLIHKTYPDYKLLESDPAAKLLEVVAYRELLLRAKINDSAKECLLAFASQSNLDHLAALLGVSRDGKDESDDSLRSRALLSFDRFSTAGCFNAYLFQAKKIGASLGLIDVYAFSLDDDKDPSTRGQIGISLLFDDHSNAETLKDKVKKIAGHLAGPAVRPLSDRLDVRACEVRTHPVKATLYILYGVDPDKVKEEVIKSLIDFDSKRFLVGGDITVSSLHAALTVPNVLRVALDGMSEDLKIGPWQACKLEIDPKYITIELVGLGGRDVATGP